MEISGKVAVVTGGASGLGAATAKMIVEEGGHVVIVDLNDQAGQALAKDLGNHARFVRADVTDPAEAQAAVETAMEPSARSTSPSNARASPTLSA
jgi:NAD(P)-dependent dehydrogenase (short-subunit alcohol dehydrogenase family)